MHALDVIWTPQINNLKIECECGNIFYHEMHISLIECDCGRKQWYLKEFEAFNNIYINAKSINWDKFNCGAIFTI